MYTTYKSCPINGTMEFTVLMLLQLRCRVISASPVCFSNFPDWSTFSTHGWETQLSDAKYHVISRPAGKTSRSCDYGDRSPAQRQPHRIRSLPRIGPFGKKAASPLLVDTRMQHRLLQTLLNIRCCTIWRVAHLRQRIYFTFIL